MKTQTVTYFLFWASQVAFFLFNFISSQQLQPVEYSLFVIVLAVMFFGIRFVDVGIGDYFVIKGDAKDLKTLFTVNIIKGLMLFIVCVFSSFLINDFYQTEELAAYIFMSAFIFLIEPLKNPIIFKYYKEKRIIPIIILEKGLYLLSFIFGIIFMLHYQSVWVLVFTYLFYFTSQTLCSYIFLPIFENTTIRINYIKDVIAFSKYIIIFIFLTYFLRQGMDLVIPKLIGLSKFAIFSFTFLIGVSPTNFLTYPFNKLIYPIYVLEKKKDTFPIFVNNIFAYFMYLLAILGVLIYIVSPIILEYFNHTSLFDRDLLSIILVYGFVRGVAANLGTIFRSLDQQNVYNKILLSEGVIIFVLFALFHQNSIEIMYVLLLSMVFHLLFGLFRLNCFLKIDFLRILKNIVIIFIFISLLLYFYEMFNFIYIIINVLLFIVLLFRFFIFIKPNFSPYD